MSKRAWRYLLIAAVVVGVWYYYHMRCPSCQKQWTMWKNRIGSGMIEPKPKGTTQNHVRRAF